MDPLWVLFVGIVVVVGGILALRLHAFLALILGALIVAALTSSSALTRFAQSKKLDANATERLVGQSATVRVATEFGNTCGKIGILIAMASIVGKCLLDSGAADRIVRSAMGLLGQARAGLAFLGSGYLLGIPVFFDTVFLLMIPLAKATRLHTGGNYLLYITAIIAGGTMTHSLVPPTPGPLFVAAELKVPMGLMILGGCVVGAITAATGYGFALWLNRRLVIPLRETGQTSLAELEALSRRDERELPPLWLSLLPILLPVLLISNGAVVDLVLDGVPEGSLQAWQTGLRQWSVTLGDSSLAMTIAAAIAMGTLAWTRRLKLGDLAKATETALLDGGLIILITSAGGAFGGVLQQSGIGVRIQELAAQHNLNVLVLAWSLTALIRFAQGSATVAMMTAVGIVGGMATPEQLGFHPLYLALAIGCGSKPLPWMNDSGFWVVGKMSGMTVNETLKIHTSTTTIMGVVGLFATLLLAKLFPLT